MVYRPLATPELIHCGEVAIAFSVEVTLIFTGPE
jgi:hypothetical protein